MPSIIDVFTIEKLKINILIFSSIFMSTMSNWNFQFNQKISETCQLSLNNFQNVGDPLYSEQ